MNDQDPSARPMVNGRPRLTPAFRPAQREKPAPCQAGCATSGDVRGWIAAVAQREKLGLSRDQAYARAWEMITDVNPFPSVMGRVCPHPCESGCNRSALDEPLAINAMERFLGDWALGRALPLSRLSSEPREEWIGVVGAGPSGLSFAYQMARRGYRVTVYEGREKAGGMLRYGIPDYRLPPEVLDGEIGRILALGVELRTDTRVGRDVTLEELRSRHAALYLGIGAQRGRGLGVPGEEGPGVWTGTDYLGRVNRGETVALGAEVVVVGGGNTAVDAARTARRSGARVTLLYRRSREEMPAIAHEVEDALEEGIELVLLAAPVRLERQNGRLGNLHVQRMELGEPDSSGRRRPVPIPGSEFRIRVDSVIAAVSQEPDTAGLPGLGGNGGWLDPAEDGSLEEGLWAGGDARELGIAGFAIAQGRHAAEALFQRLTGIAPKTRRVDGSGIIGPESINLAHLESLPAAEPPRMAPADRLGRPLAEVQGVITERQFLEEASRCFSCGSCFGCQQCSMYCTSGCYLKLEEVRPGMYLALS
ncbi:MAG: FAD-dependent oxidoreductase, partial [Longimicrobiales bacterium]